jgi:hypothetical protein
MGATAEEIACIRTRDRTAQSVTAANERASEAALGQAENRLDGSLTLVRLPHCRTSPVLDRLALAAVPDDPPDTLVVSPSELNFAGSGGRVRALAKAFPAEW